MKKVVFETSFEVCNKVGGIYTVVQSKAQYMKQLSDEYFLIGPYFKEKNQDEFEELPIPIQFQKAFGELEKEGIFVHYGKWLIEGEPITLLVEFSQLFHHINSFKKELWDAFGVDSYDAPFEFNEPLVFGVAVAKIIQKMVDTEFSQDAIIAHAHEWMCGFSNLYLQLQDTNIKTIFSTHATTLGRSICSNGVDLYSALEGINSDEKAKEFGVYQKHTAEKAAAQHSTIFATVSEITALESEHILGRKPEVLLLNGLDSRQFPTYTEIGTIHKSSRERIDEFLKYYFFPYHSFDISKTQVQFISGRHEIENKGIDVTIQTLGKLNQTLKSNPDEERTIVCFIFVPFTQYGIRKEILEQKVEFRRITRYITQISEDMQKQLLHHFLQNKDVHDFTTTVSTENINIAKKLTRAFDKKEEQAPISTHYIDEDNIIQKLLTQNGLHNRKEDRVKIVYYPSYLSSVDTLLDMTYYQTTTGCDLGLFCSYYEPWGYTPLEGNAVGVPTVTTDLAGYGKYVQNHPHDGVFVLSRRNTPTHELISQYHDTLMHLLSLTRVEYDKLRMQAKMICENADWQTFIQNYKIAQDLALEDSHGKN
ncbi:MAG: glycogen/starch synthase [Candidatus Woesearchaeota archaeon]